MKNSPKIPLVLSILFFALTSKKVVAQDSSSNYTDMVNSITHLYDSVPPPDSSEGSDLAAFSKWQSFWSTRVAPYNGNSASFMPAINKIMSMFANPTGLCNGDPNTSDLWYNNGWTDITMAQTPLDAVYTRGKGRANKVLVDLKGDPTGNTIYLATPYSGVWATTNGKAATPNWQCITTSLRLPALGVNDMALDPNNSNVLFISTGIGGDFNNSYGIEGLIKLTLTKSGSTITATASATGVTSGTLHQEIDAVAIIPTSTNSSGNIILAGETITKGDMVIWKSTDDGATFTKVTLISGTFNTSLRAAVEDIKIGFDINTNGNPSIYASTTDRGQINGGAHLFKSIDLGDSWSEISLSSLSLSATDRIDVAVTPLDADLIYAIGAGEFLLKSTDKGNTWTSTLLYTIDPSDNSKIPIFAGNDIFRNDIAVSTLDKNIIYCEGFHINKAVFNGNTPALLPSFTCGYCKTTNSIYIHPDQRGLFIMDDGTSDIIFSANDGGLVKCVSNSNGTTVTDLSGSGLNIGASYGLDITEKGDFLLAGLQDNGEYQMENGEWHSDPTATRGDAYRAAIDKTSNIMYLENNYQGIIQRTSTRWEDIDAPNKDNQALLIHNERVYYGSQVWPGAPVKGLFFRPNVKGGLMWTHIPGPQDKGADINVSAIAMASNDDNTLYIASTPDGGDHHGTIFKTNDIKDATPTWTDIKSTLPISARAVNALVVDPQNSSRVWAFLGGFNSDNSDQNPHRAFFSNDGGSTWIACSLGLDGVKDFPVDCAVYQDGTTDAIYIGTDVGVFFNPHASDPNSSWVCYNKNLPVGIISSLTIDYCNNKLLATNYGYGFWEAPLAVSSTVPVQITSNQTWNSTTISHTSLEIKPGVTLTLNANLEMANGTSITVDPGASLIVDGLNKTDETGGKITDICGSSWDGIYVAGANNQPQTTVFQGQLILKNNAVLDNARTAVHTYKQTASGNIDWTTTGAIIQATNTTFRNNRRDAEFLTYRPGLAAKRERRNLSYFNLCKFLTDDNCPTPGDQLAPYVTMFEANGVAFNGCTFRDDRTNIGDVGRIGIYAIRSGIYANRYCTDSRGSTYNCFGTSTPNTFTNLKYGINAQSLSNPALTVNVINSTFNNCHRGVYLTSVDNARIDLNTFQIPVEAQSLKDNPCGIYLEACTGYDVQDNNMQSTVGLPQSEAAVGLVIKSSGNNVNKYYNNQFNGLSVGGESIDQNKQLVGNGGLQFLCNTHNTNGTDLFVTADQSFPATFFIGMATAQGALKSPAGNFFTYTGIPSSLRTVSDNGDFMRYYHNDPSSNPANRIVPQTYTSNFIPTYSRTNQANCPDRLLGTQVEPPTIGGISTLANIIMTAKIGKRGKTDGGNTQDLINSIQCGSCDPTPVYNSLMATSPWVSEQALIAVASDQSILTPDMIASVCVANPQSARSRLVQNTLDARQEPLTLDMRNEINAVQNVFTARDTLLDSIADMQYQLADATNELLREYTDSTDTASMSTIANLLLTAHEPEYDYRLAGLYFGVNDGTSGNLTLEQLPGRYFPEEIDNNYLTEFSNYYNQIYNWQTSGKNLASLSAGDISTLNSYALNEDNIGHAAIALLQENNSSSYTEPVYLPQSTDIPFHISNALNEQAKKKSVHQYFQVFPNPACSQLTISYNTGGKGNNLIIYDITGKIVLQKQLVGEMGNVNIDVAGLPPGQYICQLMNKTSVLDMQKLSIQK